MLFVYATRMTGKVYYYLTREFIYVLRAEEELDR